MIFLYSDEYIFVVVGGKICNYARENFLIASIFIVKLISYYLCYCKKCIIVSKYILIGVNPNEKR